MKIARILKYGKSTQVLTDKKAARDGYLRIVDESGEDYLYPESYFIALRLSEKAKKAISSQG